jgi:4-amino-4-deoxy-L-arabinose transferase-like glycosyltransferase
MPAEQKQDRSLLILSIVIFFTFIAKLLLLVDFKNLPLLGDDYLYWARSQDILSGYFRRLDLQAPLYAVFLAVNRLIFGERALIIIKTEQLILQSAEIYLIYILASQYFPKKTALLAGIIAAIYPEPVSYGYLLFSETFYLFFVLSALILYFSAVKNEKSTGLALMAGAGFISGLASLTRSVNFYFLPLLCLHYWFLGRRSSGFKLAAVSLFCLAMFAPVSVQTIKNYKVEGCFILIDTSAAKNFYRSHSPSYPINMDFRGNNTLTVDRAPCPESNACAQIKCEASNSLQFVMRHPGLSLNHAAINIINLYSPNLIIYKNIFKADPALFERAALYQGRWFRAVGSFSYLLVMLLALLGIFTSREWQFRSFAVLWIFYLSVICAVFVAASRYRMPFVPFMVIYAASFLGMGGKDYSEAKKWKIPLAIFFWLIFIFVEHRRLLLILS